MKHTINAIGIAVKDIKIMAEFYRDVMEFEIDWDGGPFASAQQKNGGWFNLYQRPDNSELLNPLTYPAGLNGTFQFTCDIDDPADVDREYARLLDAGATPIIAPTTWPWAMRSCFVADPEGNQIEILAHVKQSAD
ncbi:MAG: VOC family protein [Anaerolineaceae bacterium]|nr:VOC family protein [Anaerolineaceae bacterium]